MASANGSEAIASMVRCLRSCLYAVDGEERKAAERQLEGGVCHPGFSSTLASIATEGALTNNDVGVRQLAAVILKQVIKKHWSAEALKFEDPELPRGERTNIQAILPNGLSDANSKVRTAVAMCIAAISKADPDGWPGLVENLVGAIHSHRVSLTPLVHGAICCLSLLSDDIDEHYLPQLARSLLPELLHVAADSSPATPEDLRASALSIFYDIIKSLAVMGAVYQRQVRDLLVPLVDPWLPLLCGVVTQPMSIQDTSGWAVRMLCLKSLTQLVSYFSKPLQQHVQHIMQASWEMYTSSLGLYQMHLVLEPSEGGMASEGDLHGKMDPEGNTLDLESLLAQLFELLMALVGLPRYTKIIRPALPEMSYLVVSYMQMTAGQATEWLENPAQYVADEEDNTFTVRVSGELLIESLIQAFNLEAARALVDAVERRTQEAAASQAAGQAGWWKLREAALLALGCCTASFPEGLADVRGGGGRGHRQRATIADLQSRLQRLMDEVLRTDLQGPLINPLLVGRAMWLVARLQPILRPDHQGPLLAAAAAGLNSNLPSPVKIGACRALASLAPRVPAEVLGSLADSLYGGVLGLLACSGEEALNLVLESMVPLIKADPTAAARALPALSTPLLQVWSRYVTDPLLAQSSLGVLGALARVPQCLGPLAQQVLPVVAKVVRQPRAQPDGLVEGCLDLLAKLVRPGKREVVTAVAASCCGSLIALLPGGPAADVDDDTGALTHGATELLVELVRAGGEDFLSWAAPSLTSAAIVSIPGASSSSSSASLSPMFTSPTGCHGGPLSAASDSAVFAALLGTTLRMLDPAADEYRTCLAGDLAAALVHSLPSRAAVQPVLGELLEACCRKLAASNLSPLVGGLLAALGHMALIGGAGGWLEALGTMQMSHDGGTPISGLQTVLPVLLERHSDVRGALATRVLCLALLAMLQSRHPHLMAITVRGKRHDLDTGVRTRRQAAAAGGEQWMMVPAAVKMAAVLAELLADQRWLVEEEVDESENDDDDGDDDISSEDIDEGDDDSNGDEQLEEGDAMNDVGNDVTAAASGLGFNLTISGKRINQLEQASIDAHINRSPMLPVLVSSYSNEYDCGLATQSQQKDPLILMDIRAHLVNALRPLQHQPDSAAFLTAALDLLPAKKQQQVLQLLADA
ncbi:hypothetical protein VaNZ11_012019 [Volvox africanus]|uniref:Importin N-terminal domain-containing protein n=1 Tax=Volvox africanus TaxID=51714 RepID=A0ABQ5SCZ3_9CHLO|nr:hypothetical protein VaNZ11_012019 [Volvox africanus]